MQNSIIVVKDSASKASDIGPLVRIITDAVGAYCAYVLNFILCDLMYHNFDLKQSIKGSYWIILGPVLFIFGPTLTWVKAWIHALISKEIQKIEDKVGDWWDSIDPFGIFAAPVKMVASSTFSEKALKSQREELEYLVEIHRIY